MMCLRFYCYPKNNGKLLDTLIRGLGQIYVEKKNQCGYSVVNGSEEVIVDVGGSCTCLLQ
jgi:hypothetical protein